MHMEDAVGIFFVRAVVAQDDGEGVLVSDLAEDGGAGVVRGAVRAAQDLACGAVERFPGFDDLCGAGFRLVARAFKADGAVVPIEDAEGKVGERGMGIARADGRVMHGHCRPGSVRDRGWTRPRWEGKRCSR